MATGTKIIPAFVIGALVGGGITYFGLGYPAGNELFGTVAPAERYQAEQPSADQIALGDESLQAVMQSDAFAKLIADEAFNEAIQDDRIVELMKYADLRRLAADGRLTDLLADGVLAEAINDERIADLLSAPEFGDRLVRLAVMEGIRASGDRIAAAGENLVAGENLALGEELVKSVREQIVANFAEHGAALLGDGIAARTRSSLESLVGGEAFRSAMLNMKSREMLAGNRLSELVRSADFDQLMSISASARGSFGDFAAFGDLLTSPGAENLFTNNIFGAALVDDKIADFIRGDLFAELISNGDLLSQVQENIQAR